MNHLQFTAKCKTTRAKRQGQGFENVQIFFPFTSAISAPFIPILLAAWENFLLLYFLRC